MSILQLWKLKSTVHHYHYIVFGFLLFFFEDPTNFVVMHETRICLWSDGEPVEDVSPISSKIVGKLKEITQICISVMVTKTDNQLWWTHEAPLVYS